MWLVRIVNFDTRRVFFELRKSESDLDYFIDNIYTSYKNCEVSAIELDNSMTASPPWQKQHGVKGT